MPQLGLGLGLDKSNYLKPLPKWLTDAGCTFAINVDRQVKQAIPPLAPRALPNGVFNDPYLKRVSDDYALKASDIGGVLDRANFTQAFVATTIFNPPTVAFVDAVQGTIKVNGWAEKASSFSGSYVPNLFATRSDNVFIFDVPLGTTLEQARALLAGTVIRYQLATPVDIVNSPLINPLVDITKKGNNVTLQSFAGNTADGYTQIALPNGKNPWFLNQDGTDSYMVGVNTADTEIIGTINFGLGFYIRTNGTLVNSWLISKAESSEATTQYGVKITSGGELQIFLNGTAITLATGLAINTPYKIVIVREAGVLKCEVNDVETYSVANVISLTTRPNLRLGARSSNVGGTTHTEFYNGYYGAFDLSQGSLCTLASFKKSFAKLIGGTYV